MFTNRLFVLAIGLALLMVAALVFETRPAASAVVSSSALAVGAHFPGKEQDDLAAGTAIGMHFPGKAQDDIVAGVSPLDRHFTGKEQDDLVPAGIAIGRHFPGKEKDDLVAAGSAIDNYIPGKEKGDLFVSDLPDVRLISASQGYTPSNPALVADPSGMWHTPAYQGHTP